ncbi:MAG: AAA family ATPase [Bacilli bacterium]|nr:AAA family ATPase [Bacilli bacterium]
MNNYKAFYNFLLNSKMITPIWEYILELIEIEIKDNKNKNYYLIIFSVYFSLIGDGNICISLNKEILKNKWNVKVNATKILLSENEDYNEEEFNDYYNFSINVIDNYLEQINNVELPQIIGDNKVFQIDNNYLYVKKYDVARKGIISSIDRIFSKKRNIQNSTSYKEFVNDGFNLSEGQEKSVIEGLNKNLIITGGPGTGKTTSILFLLINLLKNYNNEITVYLVAPSGKASSRMKESIINGLVNIKEEYKKQNQDIIDKINNLEESTIHRLLSVDMETCGFAYNKNHQFNSDSLFVIDESSMIDVCLFNSLLESIPDDSLVYIMGDKNQLPSVECGAVFGDLLKKQSLKENIIELDESIRFRKGTKIYELAYCINNGLDIPVNENDWKDFDTFEIKKEDPTKPIFYYNINKEGYSIKDIIDFVSNKWANEYFKSLQKMATNLDHNDIQYLKELFKYTESSKILCAENKGPRGIQEINKFIKKTVIDYSMPTTINGYYPGMLMMINKNNKMLDLYNGDSGILVTFEKDPTLYFMVKKATNLVKEEGKFEDKIFKIDDFTFYPLRLITRSEIDLSYAITIHKSQGSDYKNILVILPTAKGHPLLNRQIIYTAITRTKGNTYILSNQERLIESKDCVIVRDTNIE